MLLPFFDVGSTIETTPVTEVAHSETGAAMIVARILVGESSFGMIERQRWGAAERSFGRQVAAADARHAIPPQRFCGWQRLLGKPPRCCN
jgi:hypothetical protein